MNNVMLNIEIAKTVDEMLGKKEVFTLYDVTKRMKENISKNISSDPQEKAEQEEILKISHYDIKKEINNIVQSVLVSTDYTFTSCKLIKLDDCPRANVFHPTEVDPNCHYQINGTDNIDKIEENKPDKEYLITCTLNIDKIEEDKPDKKCMVQSTLEGRINIPKEIVDSVFDEKSCRVTSPYNSIWVSVNKDGRMRVSASVLGFKSWDEMFVVSLYEDNIGEIFIDKA
ncbi:MAG: hypothetical protein WC942_12435 [Clostridia bacterium]|jgi:hypothetical protein